MSVTLDEITQDYARYITAYPAEQQRLVGLGTQLAYSGADPASPLSREHVTSSAALFSPEGHVLLTPVADVWTFPGGHVDSADGSLLSAAQRHLREATRLSRGAVSLPALQRGSPLDYEDEETRYPDGERHLHRAFLFAFRLTDVRAEASLKSLGDRIDDFRWVPVAHFVANKRLHSKLLGMAATA